MGLTPAERLLQELGVTEPKDIDLEAIAHYMGARIKYRPLDGCDARIVGVGDKAIIAVNTRNSPQRKRFSMRMSLVIGSTIEVSHWCVGSTTTGRTIEYRQNGLPTVMRRIS